MSNAVAHKYRCIGYSWILYSNYGPVRFCLWILYQEQRVSPSSPPLPTFFAFVFTSVLQLMRGNVHWYVYHQEANWGRTFMRLQLVNSIFITKILSCHKLWHYILQNKENKRQIPSSLSIHLRLRGGTGNKVSWPTKLSKYGCGGVAVRHGDCRLFCEEL